MITSRIIPILALFFIFSCGDRAATSMMFSEDVLPRLDSLMRRQVVIMKDMGKPDSVRTQMWQMKDGEFFLNGIVDSVITDYHLRLWGLESETYSFLKKSSFELSREMICGAYNTSFSHTLAFLYRCDISGFDSKERIIYLKEENNPGPFTGYLIHKFDENQYMIMGY